MSISSYKRLCNFIGIEEIDLGLDGNTKIVYRIFDKLNEYLSHKDILLITDSDNIIVEYIPSLGSFSSEPSFKLFQSRKFIDQVSKRNAVLETCLYCVNFFSLE